LDCERVAQSPGWLIRMPFRNLGIVLGGVREPVKRWIQDFRFDFAAG